MQAPDPRAFTTFAEFQDVFQAAFAATQTRPGNLLRQGLVLAEGTAARAEHGVGFGVTVAAMRHRWPESAEARSPGSRPATQAGATAGCVPLDGPPASGRCTRSGLPSGYGKRVIFGRAH